MSRAAIAAALKAAKNKAGKARTTKNKPMPTAKKPDTYESEMKAIRNMALEPADRQNRMAKVAVKYGKPIKMAGKVFGPKKLRPAQLKKLTPRETAKAEMKAANRAKMEAKRAADKKAKGQALGKALKAKAAEYESMGGYNKARDFMAAKGVAGLRGVGRPMSVDIAIYEAQKNIRRLAKAAGMSVKNWRRNNTSSKWVKQLYKAKPDMKKADALRGKKKP